MLAELRMEIEDSTGELGYFKSSNLQGIIMETINPEYAEQLHIQGRSPYSQHLEVIKEGNIRKTVWVISTLTSDAYENIILPLLKPDFSKITFKKSSETYKISNKQVSTKDKKELLERFNNVKGEQFLNLEFITPTSFKSNGKYVIYPDIRLLFTSLMNKYDVSSEDMHMYDEDTLEQIINDCCLVRYDLKSTFFPLEGIRVPGFKGKIGIKITGTDTIKRYARFLSEFGEYSGVGIKCGMGMGALRISKEVNAKHD